MKPDEMKEKNYTQCLRDTIHTQNSRLIGGVRENVVGNEIREVARDQRDISHRV